MIYAIKKLVRAKELIDGLGGEQTRWTEKGELSEEYTNLTGNVLVSSGLMAYLGPFTSEFRDNIMGKWVLEVQTARYSLF